MFPKVIPKPVFQVFALGSFGLILFRVGSWVRDESGLYGTLTEKLAGLGDTLVVTTLAILLAFFALFIPWFFALLILREFAHGMPTIQDEMAYVRGEKPLPTTLENPADQTLLKGTVSIGIAVILLLINLFIWNVDQSGILQLWIAVPVALVLGLYWLGTGLREKANQSYTVEGSDDE